MNRVKYSDMMVVYCNYCQSTNNKWFICKDPKCKQAHKDYLKERGD